MAVESDGQMYGAVDGSISPAGALQPGESAGGTSPLDGIAGEMGHPLPEMTNPTSEVLQQLIAVTDEAGKIGPNQADPTVMMDEPAAALSEPVTVVHGIEADATCPQMTPKIEDSAQIYPQPDAPMTVMTAETEAPAMESSAAPMEATMARTTASAELSTEQAEVAEHSDPNLPAEDAMDPSAGVSRPARRLSMDWEERFSHAREFGMRAMRSAFNVRQTFSAMSLMLRQTDVIFSGRHSQGTGRARPETTDGMMLVRLPADQMQQAGGVFSPAPPSQGAILANMGEPSTIIYFYDGSASVAQSLEEVRRLRTLGCNVLCVDYLGYGMSSGQASEKTCYSTAEAAFDYLAGREDIDTRHIIACGHRMGAAVAVELAVRRRLSGLMLVDPITNMMDVIRQGMPDLRMPILLKHRFDCESRLSAVQCPILLAHPIHSPAADDEPDTLQRLLMAAHAPVCNVAIDMSGEECAGVPKQMLVEARQFVAELPAAEPQANQQRLTLLLPPKVPTRSRGQSTGGPRIREAC